MNYEYKLTHKTTKTELSDYFNEKYTYNNPPKGKFYTEDDFRQAHVLTYFHFNEVKRLRYVHKRDNPNKSGGFKPNLPATLYFIKIGENTLGYGISNNFKTRLTQHKRTFNENGVEFEVLHTVAFEDGQVCLDAERLLKNNLPHNGCTLKGFKTEATAMSYFNEAKRLVSSLA